MRLVRLERQQSRVADDVRAALASLGRGSTVIGGIALVGVGSVTERPIEAVVLLPHGVIIVIGVDLPDPALRLEAPLGAPWKADGWPLVADDDAVNPATEALDISQACERRIAELVPGTAPVGTIIAVGPYVETVDQPAGDLAGPVRVLHPTPTTMLAATVSLATAHRPRSVDQVRALIRGLAPSAPEFSDEVLLGEGFSRLTDDSPPESLWDSAPAPPAQPVPTAGSAAAASVATGSAAPTSADTTSAAAGSTTPGPAAQPAAAAATSATTSPPPPDSTSASAAAGSTTTSPAAQLAAAAASAAPSSAAASETGWRTRTPMPAASDTAPPEPETEPADATTPPAARAATISPATPASNLATTPPAEPEPAAESDTPVPAEPGTTAPPEAAAKPEPDLPPATDEEALAASAPTEVLPPPAQDKPAPPARPVFPGAEDSPAEAEPAAPHPTAPEPPLPVPVPRSQPEPAAATSRTVRWLPLGAIGLLVVLVVAAIAVATTGDRTAAAPPPPPVTSPPSTAASKPAPVESLQFALRAADGDQRCASHAFGDAQASLQQTSCSGVRRASYAATVDGRPGAVTIGIVEFPDAGHAAAFKAVADTPGGGGILDLATETGKWGATAPRFENAAYASKLEGTSVRLVQAVWAPGPSTPDDPGLARAAKAALDLPVQ